MTQLRIILGDQCAHNIAALSDIDQENDIILLCEVWEEATYVKHHKKKIAFIFSVMRHFAEELKAIGYHVDYIKLDDPDNSGSFFGEIQRAVKRHQPDGVVVTYPGEYRVWHDMQQWHERLELPVEIRDDHRFLCDQDTFAAWAKGRKQLRMEYFYRQMRKDHNILMDGEEPVGGKWNYDAENRKPPKQGLDIPAPYAVQIDEITSDVLKLVADRFEDHFGDLEPFYFAVTRDQALYCLNKFIDERLHHFGTYQDAMIEGEPWMYHSHLSFYINCGLLDPRECIDAAEQAYREKDAPLNAVEGFIRQILGWREYVRGIYWLNMPEYADANKLEATRNLPWFYWTGETKMNCLKQCITETKENAYAHHIQRLMVLGNFTLIAGIDPAQVNEWYLVVYADAYEWVEMPNVTGMILFADGGFLASKPYASSGSYINKMSNYCSNCEYKVSEKNGEQACPFNYLYWDFLARHRERFASNQRMAMMYKTYDRMGDDKKALIAKDSKRFFKALEADKK